MHSDIVAKSRMHIAVPSPSKPSPETHSPMTAPLLNAILSALGMPDVRAAFAVLTLPFVATFMPKNPARTEKSAPMT